MGLIRSRAVPSSNRPWLHQEEVSEWGRRCIVLGLGVPRTHLQLADAFTLRKRACFNPPNKKALRALPRLLRFVVILS